MARYGGTLWEGVALRRARVGADPDAPERPVALPAAWDDGAAAALAALAPVGTPASLPLLAESVFAKALARGRKGALLLPGEAEHLAAGWRALLLARQGAPGAEAWRGDLRAEPRFVLNLAAFANHGEGLDLGSPDLDLLDLEALDRAARLGVRFLDCWTGGRAPRLRLGFAGLAGLLARLRLPYDSDAARRAGAGVAALLRGVAEHESGALAARLGAREPVCLFAPPPPADTPVPGLAEAARAALDAAAGAPGLRHGALLVLAQADATEALLDAGAAGFAPLPGAAGNPAARQRMAEAVSPFLHAAPPPPAALPAPPRPLAAPRPVPRRRPGHGAGRVLHVGIGGHKVALRTATEHGRLREIAFSLAKEGAAYRSLMDGFAQAVSAGLQRGVPLADYVELFAYTRFGPAGLVEGDPDIPRATSVLDWAFRRLALDHLGGTPLPQPEPDDVQPDAEAGAGMSRAGEQAPLLPMDLPEAGGRRRTLKLVG